ncbi:MAG: exodeoxyribonuclease VII large subunit [Ardenticatenia bacterium]|nr:MAG: exodeoxyribonuclease VII large subunit [Ardenticatenia bacterium]
MQWTPWSVSELTTYISTLFDEDEFLQNVLVRGEVSNWSRASSGHCYFTIKDADAQLKCVMWKTAAARLLFDPMDGDEVIVWGRVGVYATRGLYQLYAEGLQPVGQGALYAQFDALKRRLEAEGLFDAARKRPLPRYPRRIGVVTSLQAAALRDILNVLRRRYPLAEILISPTLVQGDEAPPQIVEALRRLYREDVDVILLARGGGSIEELWAFNDERVVRTVAESPVPLITGVGHETDFTLVDFAADCRAPTPSAAAEMATPNSEDVLADVQRIRQALTTLVRQRLTHWQRDVEHAWQRLDSLTPEQHVQRLHNDVAAHRRRLADLTQNRLRLLHMQLQSAHAQLRALDPHAVLQRGYAMVRNERTGRFVHSIHDVAPGDQLQIHVADGTIHAIIPPKEETDHDGDTAHL